MLKNKKTLNIFSYKEKLIFVQDLMSKNILNGSLLTPSFQQWHSVEYVKGSINTNACVCTLSEKEEFKCWSNDSKTEEIERS